MSMTTRWRRRPNERGPLTLETAEAASEAIQMALRLAQNGLNEAAREKADLAVRTLGADPEGCDCEPEPAAGE